MVFKFFKNQEIPEFFYNLETDTYSKTPSQKALQEDYVDINLTLIDNGDEKVCLQSMDSSLIDVVGLNEKRTQNLVCQMFMPQFEPSKIMFAGKS